MKRLAVLLFVLISYSGISQYYAPTGAVWYYGEEYFSPFLYEEGFMRYEVTGDTLISGKTCQIISKDNYWECGFRPDREFIHYANDTVFFYDTVFAEFQILYDFNATQGDYWEIITPDNNLDLDTIRVSVDSTDIVNINGQNLKRLYVEYELIGEYQSYTYTSSIVERIGDVLYMFNFFAYESVACDGDWSNGLRCYTDSVLGHYETGIADSCDMMVPYPWGVEELNTPVSKIVRVVDLLGRHTEDLPNTPLIYIYDDGTVERVYRIE